MAQDIIRYIRMLIFNIVVYVTQKHVFFHFPDIFQCVLPVLADLFAYNAPGGILKTQFTSNCAQHSVNPRGSPVLSLSYTEIVVP